MLLSQWIDALKFAVYVLLFSLVFVSVYYFFTVLISTRRISGKIRLRSHSDNRSAHSNRRHWIHRGTRESQLELYRQWFASCGLRFDARWYVAIRKLVLTMLSVIGATSLGVTTLRIPMNAPFVPIFLISLCIGLVFLFDQTILRILAIHRSRSIVKEIYAVSKHLLYYSGSSMNVHGKLMRCLPLTKVIRAEMERLLNEWYHDAELALERFKQRLGSEEAYSFVETLKSLRLHDDGRYYELLRQRIADYKERIEMAADSKKETTSYVLFVLAGIPIIYTFRVFIYPWVLEGQRIFDSLG